jgi:hypothetical protein
MFNVCPNCGEYTVEKRIDPSGPFAACPHCQYAHPFLQHPLFFLSGASGTALPEHFEDCPERRYFSTLYYLTLVCDDDLLVERLQHRPEWRMTHTPKVLEDMVQFNRWLKANASLTSPPMTLYDTSHKDINETVEYVAKWVRERL